MVNPPNPLINNGKSRKFPVPDSPHIPSPHDFSEAVTMEKLGNSPFPIPPHSRSA